MAKWKLNKNMISEQIAKAKERTRLADAAEPQAKAAYYDQSANRIVVELSNGTDFRFSPSSVEELIGASPDEIAQVEISPSGRTLRWKKLDADLSLPALMMGIFGTKMWMAHLGRTGGQATSQAKVAAARLNGIKGGRPKKVVHVTRGARSIMAEKETVKPGEKTPDSGIYKDESGKKTTQVEGHTAPPTGGKGEKHKQDVDTNPDNDKK